MTKTQKQKFIDGYNLKVANWNSDISDKGRTPVRGYAADGYEAARSEIVNRQLAQNIGDESFKMTPITIAEII